MKQNCPSFDTATRGFEPRFSTENPTFQGGVSRGNVPCSQAVKVGHNIKLYA